MMLNKNLQEINIQNMDTELVAQMFKNYQSNVLFHLEGKLMSQAQIYVYQAADYSSNKRTQGPSLVMSRIVGRIWKPCTCLATGSDMCFAMRMLLKGNTRR